MEGMAASSTLNFTYVTNNLDMSKDVIKVCGLIWMAGPPRAWQELSLQCRNTSCEESDQQLRQCYDCISNSGMVCRNDTINSTIVGELKQVIVTATDIISACLYTVH